METAIAPLPGLILNGRNQHSSHPAATMLRCNVKTCEPGRDWMARLKFRTGQEAHAGQNAIQLRDQCDLSVLIRRESLQRFLLCFDTGVENIAEGFHAPFRACR